MKKRGFTLIELLAVIVILAVIALIATPLILNIINKAKKSAFLDSAYGIVESAKLYYTESVLDGNNTDKTFLFEGDNGLRYHGTKPKGGVLTLSRTGEIALAIHSNIYCALKVKNDSKITMIPYDSSTCILPENPLEPKSPSIEEKVKESNEIMQNDPDRNRRYVGSNPNNYVSFNNELWRVIGIFNGQAKIIRKEPYKNNIVWNHTINDWSVATLKTELNETYLNGINRAYKNMIDQNHLWNLGGAPSATSYWTRTNMYSYERGTTVYSGRPTTWTGAIGLAYVSDYGYSTSATNGECDATMYHWSGSGNVANCKNNSWLYNLGDSQWTLTLVSSSDSDVFYVSDSDAVYYAMSAYGGKIFPVLYLISSIKITDGEGSETNPYQLTA